MKSMSLHEIRKVYLDFFKEKDHLVVDSYPLVPKNDKSLLIINAGMAPLKPYFTGAQEPPKRRMATCQKCVRTGDIENVGRTSRHGTFFEMLGNFSFGDYFKKEAIEWAWEFMTKKMEVPEEKLWVSVYYEDDEAYDIWNKIIGVNSNRIVKLGKEDNFWELEVGPCGPSSEIYIDRGEKYGCGKADCKPGCDCDRYVEVWNLVFSQYDKDEQGNYNPLPNPNIDTGMGLERMAAVVQNTENIFETEPIKTILQGVEKVAGIKYGENHKNDVSVRVITDHGRAISFMVSDGILPSNEGRGYVLRRLIRRASRHGKLLGIEGNFLGGIIDVVIDLWKEAYPELEDRRGQIKKVVKIEEDKFQETIDQGISILEEYILRIKEDGNDTLDGESAFKLYDTYGFPIDLTKEILEEKGLKVDEVGFNKEMEDQRERARKAREESGNQAWTASGNIILGEEIKTSFEGYNKLNYNSKIISIIKNNELADSIQEGEEGIIILDNTPFYSESGGQVGDRGTIEKDGFMAEVVDTKKGNGEAILHFVTIQSGFIKNGDVVRAQVDRNMRLSTARNHSATHLLHKALKDIVGEHVNQAGSLVSPERLRFDFTHFEGLDKKTLDKIEEIVNSKILDALDVEVTETSIDEAKQIGATALFDEKYGDRVRVVRIGEYSKELCGGTHVNNSSQIAMFKIISETGIASGIRRIEAITGSNVYNHIKYMEEQISEVADVLKANRRDIIDKVKLLSEEYKNLEKEHNRLKTQLAMAKASDALQDTKEVNGVKVVTKRIDGMDMTNLRELGDKLRDDLKSVVVVLGSSHEDKVNLIAMATKDLVSKGIHVGNIIREVAKVTGGGGGGRPDVAQAGGKDPSKLEEALSIVSDLVKGQIK